MKQLRVWISGLSLLTGCVAVGPSPRPSTSFLPTPAVSASQTVSPLPSPSISVSPSPNSSPSPSRSGLPSPYPYDPITGYPDLSVLFKSLPVEVVAGSGQQGFQDGPALQASFTFPFFTAKPCFNPRDNSLYIPDTHRLRKLTADGQVVTVTGSAEFVHRDGPAAEARFGNLRACVVDNEGAVLLLDAFNRRIRRLSPDGKTVSTLLGSGVIDRKDGEAAQAALVDPNDMVLGPEGELYISDSCALRVFRNGRLTTLNPDCEPGRRPEDGGWLEGPLVSDGTSRAAEFGRFLWLAMDKRGTLYVVDMDMRALRRVDRQGNVKTLSLDSEEAKDKYGDEAWRHMFFAQPTAITYDPVRNKLFLADFTVFESDLQGNMTLIARTVSKAPEVFSSIQNGGLVMGKDNHLYVIDKGSKQIKRVLLPAP